MNSFHLKALQYIQNTNGNATLANFLEDHEPIGQEIWERLLDQRLVHINGAGKVGLTHGGAARVSESRAPASGRPSEASRAAATDSSTDISNPLNPISPLSPLNTAYESTAHRSTDHCTNNHSSSDYSSSDYSSSSYSSDSCSFSDSSSNSSDY
jgi:hypothetical protein